MRPTPLGALGSVAQWHLFCRSVLGIGSHVTAAPKKALFFFPHGHRGSYFFPLSAVSVARLCSESLAKNSDAEPSEKLRVSGLPSEATAGFLRQLFGPFGKADVGLGRG